MASVSMFRDSSLQDQLDTQGWVLVPLLNPEEVQGLLAFYAAHHDRRLSEGFHSTIFSSEISYKQAVLEAIRSAFSRSLDTLFENVDTYVANFVVKEPGPKSFVPPHQDWTMVDETRFYSLNIWCPLVDTNPENGNIGVVSGSHRWWPTLRGTPFILQPYHGHDALLTAAATYLPLKAGEAIVMDNRTIHTSPANRSTQARVAAGLGIVPKGAELYHYYLNPAGPPNQLEQYAVEPLFFLRHSLGQPPEGRFLGRVPLPPAPVSEAEIQRKLRGEGPEVLSDTTPTSEQHDLANHIPGFFQRLKQWLLGN
jgi:hypothetical protein